MVLTNNEFVGRVMDTLKKGLWPYVERRYETSFQENSKSQILKTLQMGSFNIRLLAEVVKDKKPLQDIIDPYGCLNLIIRNRSLFQDDLGHRGMAFVSELFEYRHEWAHPTASTIFTFATAHRAAETATMLLELIKANGEASETHKIADELLRKRYEQIDNIESKDFSEQMKLRMATLNKTINGLTEQQYSIIDFLRGHKKVAIAGCAGSGKTLVAVEKAIRLAKAGLKVLILCHNPHLSQYINHLCNGTGIWVIDFTSWIIQMRGQKAPELHHWTQYEEPTDEELEEVLENLSEYEDVDKYDAVIVDEGQDFRDEWWLIIEQILIKNGSLYIFYDDNQALLPQRSKYPVPQAPYKLSANCRNAGEIFDLVARFHPQAPQPSKDLIGKGIVRYFSFRESEDEIELLHKAIGEAISVINNVDNLIILTTEHDPIENSVLYNREVKLNNRIPIIKIAPPNNIKNDSFDNLCLYTVSAYKGLEAEAIILFIRSSRDEIDANLYVGLSRARILLYIVINSTLKWKIPQMTGQR